MGCSVCGKCAHCGGLGERREEREEGKHPDWETPGGLTQWHPVKVSIVFKSRFLVDKDMLSYLIYKEMKVIFKINNNSKIIYQRESLCPELWQACLCFYQINCVVYQSYQQP